MMKLIDADEYDNICREETPEQKRMTLTLKDPKKFVKAILRSFPTVDAVPVIRCKDCQYAEYTHDTQGRICYDTIYCERNDLQAIVNWFCADGRKKAGDYGGEID